MELIAKVGSGLCEATECPCVRQAVLQREEGRAEVVTGTSAPWNKAWHGVATMEGPTSCRNVFLVHVGRLGASC